MRRIAGDELAEVRRHFDSAARVAKQAQCRRDRCGSVIVKGGVILGSGFGGPSHGNEGKYRCEVPIDTSLKPKFDKTCCVHAEWRAILDACKRHGDALAGSTLYFMRLAADGSFSDAGKPYCTVCSRLTLEAGIAEFALWNADGADIYEAREYDEVSYRYYGPSD